MRPGRSGTPQLGTWPRLGLATLALVSCTASPPPPVYQPPDPPKPLVLTQVTNFVSAHLVEPQRWTLFLPQREALSDLPVVILFDGQNHERLGLADLLRRLWYEEDFPPFALVALWAGPYRLDNYGVPGRPDYQGRGGRGTELGKFLETELLPWVENQVHTSQKASRRFLVGFSFTGLGAVAQALSRPAVWGGAAAFSGSFWWRRGEDAQNTRIILELVRDLRTFPTASRFWFLAGDAEETADRDGDGVIDVVDDTLDLIAALQARGVPERNLSWTLVPGGRHHESTWMRYLEPALRWLLMDQD